MYLCTYVPFLQGTVPESGAQLIGEVPRLQFGVCGVKLLPRGWPLAPLQNLLLWPAGQHCSLFILFLLHHPTDGTHCCLPHRQARVLSHQYRQDRPREDQVTPCRAVNPDLRLWRARPVRDSVNLWIRCSTDVLDIDSPMTDALAEKLAKAFTSSLVACVVLHAPPFISFLNLFPVEYTFASRSLPRSLKSPAKPCACWRH